MAAAPPPPSHPLPPPPPSPSPLSMPFFCNGCMCELKLFDDVPTTGSRIPKQYYTNCQHVLCQKCKLRYTGQCAACKKPCRTMEINKEMRPFYRTYFEPSAKMRTNLIGAVQFQTIQSEHITSQLVAKGKLLQGKYREMEKQLADVKKERADALAERSKILIIFKTIREEVNRHKEKQRQQQRLTQEAQQQRRAQQQFQQQQPDPRPMYRDASPWFGDANQNQHQRQGHGHSFGQANYGPENRGWTGGFDAATTAQTNFGETPRTYRPFEDATTARPSHQQPDFLDPFQTMGN